MPRSKATETNQWDVPISALDALVDLASFVERGRGFSGLPTCRPNNT